MRLAESELLPTLPLPLPAAYRFDKNLQKVTSILVLQQEFNIAMFHSCERVFCLRLQIILTSFSWMRQSSCKLVLFTLEAFHATIFRHEHGRLSQPESRTGKIRVVSDILKFTFSYFLKFTCFNFSKWDLCLTFCLSKVLYFCIFWNWLVLTSQNEQQEPRRRASNLKEVEIKEEIFYYFWNQNFQFVTIVKTFYWYH